MRKKWLVLLCLLVIASGGVAIGIWSASRSEPTPSLLLPDSNRVHLVAVNVGTNAKVHFGKPIERVLARLPGKLGSRFKVNEVSANSPMSSGSHIVLWFRYDRPAQPGTYLRANIVDDDEQPRRSPTFSSHPRTLSNGLTVAHSGTHLWPRRKRTLTFRVEQALQPSHEGVQIGELTVVNQAYGNYPIWVPEKLPAARNFKNTSFILESFGRSDQTRVGVMSDGKAERIWEVWGHWLRDATGNLVTRSDELHWGGPARQRADDSGSFSFSTLSYGMPKEPAWKIGVHFVRAGALASNEVVLLRGVPASATGPRLSGTWRTNLPMGVVQLRYQPDWEDPARKPCLVPHQGEAADLTTGQNPLAIMILDAVNNSGKKIEVIAGRKIHIPTNSTTLDITIGIPLQHCVEYTVDPKAQY